MILLVQIVEVVTETNISTSTARKTVHPELQTVTRATNTSTARKTVTPALESVTAQTAKKQAKTVKGQQK